MLTIMLITGFNINAYNSSQMDAIKDAIKDSRPNLLKNALNSVKLTEQDKITLLSMAASISRARENRMNIQLIKPGERPISDGFLYRLIGLGLIPTAIVILFIAEDFSSYRESSLKKPLIITTIAGVIWAYKKLNSIAKQKDVEFLQKYRTDEQKYIDSLDVTAILKLN